MLPQVFSRTIQAFISFCYTLVLKTCRTYMCIGKHALQVHWKAVTGTMSPETTIYDLGRGNVFKSWRCRGYAARGRSTYIKSVANKRMDWDSCGFNSCIHGFVSDLRVCFCVPLIADLPNIPSLNTAFSRLSLLLLHASRLIQVSHLGYGHALKH